VTLLWFFQRPIPSEVHNDTWLDDVADDNVPVASVNLNPGT
jgi:hypothetical protein